MKRTVGITIKYFDNFKEFGTILVPGYTFYFVLFSIDNREAETAAICNAKDVGRTRPRMQQAATLYFANPFILLLSLILYCRTVSF